MKTIKLVIELKYDAESMHGGDKDLEAKEWFFNEILKKELILHSNEIGDKIGTVRILGFIDSLEPYEKIVQLN